MAQSKLTRRYLSTLEPGKTVWEGGVGYKKQANDGIWKIKYRLAPGSARRKTETVGRDSTGCTVEIARKALTSRQGEVVKGRFDMRRFLSCPTLAQFTVGDVDWRDMTPKKLRDVPLGPFLEWSRANKKSWTTDLQRIRSDMLPRWGNRTMDRIAPEDLERFKSDRLKEGRSPATINRTLALLKTIYSKAVAWGKVADNPVKQISLLRENNRRLRFLEVDELGRLLSACKESRNQFLYPLVLIVVGTGLREGEAMGLRWSDVDMDRRLLTLPDSKGGGRCTFPFSDEVWAAFLTIPKVARNPYVFPADGGKPMAFPRTAFQNALAAAEITDFHFHDLRHTYASHLVMEGVDLLTVKELLRHKSLDMTLRYAHLAPEHKRKAVDTMGGVLRNAGQTAAAVQGETSVCNSPR